ncbi:MAG: hypothetical protein J5680_03995 [Neisseriaceae bacterium]|nr:hypothetical protein [Neisseriaceae bacterium]MBR5676178.1 hypothetical protein [Neisseriaceae bacterium]
MTRFFPTETPLVRPKDTVIVQGINLILRYIIVVCACGLVGMALIARADYTELTQLYVFLARSFHLGAFLGVFLIIGFSRHILFYYKEYQDSDNNHDILKTMAEQFAKQLLALVAVLLFSFYLLHLIHAHTQINISLFFAMNLVAAFVWYLANSMSEILESISCSHYVELWRQEKED